MFEAPEITLGFIKRRPASAARVLATLPPADAAGFLAAIPTRYAAIALARMSPWSAAQILAALESDSSTPLLRELGFADAAKLLRLTRPATRAHLLAQLPQRLRRSFELSLSFPSDTVGANMVTEIATLTLADKPADALALVRRAARDTAELVFVTDDAHRYHAVLRTANLLRHPEYFTLADLLNTRCPALPAQARVQGIAALEAWDEFSQLPVVNRSGELLGALPRRALRLASASGMAAAPAATLANSLVGALSASVAGLAALVAEPSAAKEPAGDADGR